MPERYLGQILGKYRVDELVGSGGFAWVYKAFDPELEIPVALKILKPQFAGDATIVERFRREASTAAKLRHPNIVKIFAVGREGDAVYFAMDFLPNGLADRLEVVNCLPEAIVARVGMDVAAALGFAHREGVIHRDIKVDNILFDAHGNAIVADFGIARAVTGYSGHTGTNMVVGTPQYFAPEQARAKPLDGRADIYSLGVTLYRAATGRLPFEGDDWYEIARQHVEEPPPAPRTIVPALSEEFEAILLACLAKHPDDRPTSGELLCQQFAALLQGGLEHSTIRTRLATSNEPTLVVPSPAGVHAPASTPASAPPGAPGRGWRTRGWKVGLAGIAVAALAVAFVARRQQAPAASVPGRDSSAFAQSPASAGEAAFGEPLLVDTNAVRDSTLTPVHASPAPPPRAHLLVTAPAGASIRVNGVEVGGDRWRADTLKPGRYAISASVPGTANCSTATQHVTRMLGAGQNATVELSPRGCGQLTFAVRPADSRFTTRFTVSSSAGEATLDDLLPLKAPLVLPIGKYKISIARKFCGTYEDEVTIATDRATQVVATLLCAEPKP